MYNEIKNDTGDAYPYYATAEMVGYKYEKPNHNMQMICHIKREENADRDNLINLGILKLIGENVSKRLRMP